jgi:hypothetical protein
VATKVRYVHRSISTLKDTVLTLAVLYFTSTEKQTFMSTVPRRPLADDATSAKPDSGLTSITPRSGSS